MSTTTEEIIEKLKTITLFEAAELVARIEETFGVDASAPSGGFAGAPIAASEATEVQEEKTAFDVILEDVASDKRVAVLKSYPKSDLIGVKGGKGIYFFVAESSKESVSKEEAEQAKQQLEEAGGKVKIS